MADWNSLIDDPLFNAGLGLLGGASTGNPWGAAADQLNKYQALRQNREYQRMHAKVYEAQALKAQQEAEQAARAQQNLNAALPNIPEHLRGFIAADPKLMGDYAKTLPGLAEYKHEQYFDPNSGHQFYGLRAPTSTSVQPVGGIQQDINTPGELQSKLTEQQTLLPGKIAQAAAGAPRTTVDLSAFAVKEGIKSFTDSIRKSREELAGIPPLLANIEKAKELIPKAAPFMGPGAGTLLGTAKALNKYLNAGINTEGVKSAEELRARLKFGIIEFARKVDPNPSTVQVQALESALGTLDTDPNALPAVLDVISGMGRAKVSSHNKDVEYARNQGVPFMFKPDIDLPEPGKQVVRRVPLKNGKTGIEYSDGTRVVE